MIERYRTPAVVLHWLMALMVLTNIALSFAWDAVPDAQVRPLIDLHKSIGVSVLGLVIMRVLWRVGHKPPAMPLTYKPWEARLSSGVHILLYVLLFAMPLTGWIADSAWKDAASHPMHWFGLFEWPRIAAITHLDLATRNAMHKQFESVHSLSAKLLYVLIGLHVLGALKHQFLDSEQELQRMWFR